MKLDDWPSAVFWYLCSVTICSTLAPVSSAFADDGAPSDGYANLHGQVAALSASAVEQSGIGAAPQTRDLVEINLPMYIGNAFAADIAVQARNDGSVQAVDEVKFLTLLTPFLNPDTLSALNARAAATPGRWISLNEASVDGVVVGFDPATLQIAVRIDATATTVRSVSIGSPDAALPSDLVYPSNVAAGLNLTFTERWINYSRDNPQAEGLKPIAIGVDGFFNFGGIDGVYLFHQWNYDGDADHEFQRGTVTAIKDFRDSAVRVAVGDIDPVGTLLQGASSLGGIQVGTAYSEIQPNRNIRPSGRTRFVLDRPARVEVVVNGVPIRTLNLAAGQYDIRDFAFAEGVNDVRLFVEDTSGRREVAAFSAFFTTTLLDRGISDYSVAVGFEREPTAGGFRYLNNRVQATGYFRHGLSDAFTLGANFQLGRNLNNLGAEAVYATAFGTFVGQASASRANRRDGIATSLGYRLTTGAAVNPLEIEAVWDYRSRHYRALNEIQNFNLEGHEVALRVRKTLFGNLGISASAGYLHRRQQSDAVRYSLSANKSFGAVSAALLFDGTRDRLLGNRNSVLLSLTYRFGTRSTVRGQYRTRNDEKSIEYERASQNMVGDVGLRAGIIDADDRRSFEGQVDYIANRGEFGVRTERVENIGGGDRQQITTARAAVGLGFADGNFAFGRPYTNGFAIVKRHRTLRSNEVTIGSSGAGVAAVAKTDVFGPAFVSTYRGYDVQTLSVDVANAPPGYELGSARFPVLPGAASGFVLTVGSDASNTAIGTLLNSDGAPVAFKSGEVRSASDPSQPPQPFFTNRAGRFVAEKLRPGRYRLFVGGQDIGVELFIPNDANGLVNTGNLTIGSRP